MLWRLTISRWNRTDDWGYCWHSANNHNACLFGCDGRSAAFLKRKGSFIRANLHGDKRIQLVEEFAISPTEKLRLLAIDEQMFVMASAKGVQPVLSPLKQAVSPPPLLALQLDSGAKLAAQSAERCDARWRRTIYQPGGADPSSFCFA